MATLTINTSTRVDTAIKALTDRYNNTNPPPAQQLSPLEFARMQIQQVFDSLVAQLEQETSFSKADAYRKASDADKATIDAILQKYA